MTEDNKQQAFNEARLELIKEATRQTAKSHRHAGAVLGIVSIVGMGLCAFAPHPPTGVDRTIGVVAVVIIMIVNTVALGWMLFRWEKAFSLVLNNEPHKGS